MIKTVLISCFPLPYEGIASWTTMMNFFLKNKGHIDYIISPPSTIPLTHTKQYSFKTKTGLKSKVISKFDRNYKNKNYIDYLKKILQKEEKIIVQIIDNTGLLKSVIAFLQKNNLRKRVYVQFFFHGFSPFTQSEKLYATIDELILLSHSSYESFKTNVTSLPVKIKVNHNGVNDENFFMLSKEQKNKLRNEKSQDRNKLIFTWCSQDREKKGLDVLLAAWSKLSLEFGDKIKLLVIGTNKTINKDNVEVIGRVPNNELAKYYQLSDFYIFTTLCHEGFGLSLAEALKCGNYCIASDNGSVKEVLMGGKLGKLVNFPNNPDSWVDAIKEAIQDFEQNGNSYTKEIPNDLYSMKKWFNNYNLIIKDAKNNFDNRIYI